jgi:hypothetical protein
VDIRGPLEGVVKGSIDEAKPLGLVDLDTSFALASDGQVHEQLAVTLPEDSKDLVPGLQKVGALVSRAIIAHD